MVSPASTSQQPAVFNHWQYLKRTQGKTPTRNRPNLRETSTHPTNSPPTWKHSLHSGRTSSPRLTLTRPLPDQPETQPSQVSKVPNLRLSPDSTPQPNSKFPSLHT